MGCGFLVGVEDGRNGSGVKDGEGTAVGVITAVGASVAVGTKVRVEEGVGDAVADGVMVGVVVSVLVGGAAWVGDWVGVGVARRAPLVTIAESAANTHIPISAINPIPPPIHHFERFRGWPGLCPAAGLGVCGAVVVWVAIDGGSGVGFSEGEGAAGG